MDTSFKSLLSNAQCKMYCTILSTLPPKYLDMPSLVYMVIVRTIGIKPDGDISSKTCTSYVCSFHMF